MTETTVDYTQYIGKRVILSIPDDEGVLTEQEVTIQSANASALLVKPKGKTQFEIVDPSDVADVSLAPTATKKLKAKRVNPVELGQARSHLLERHGAKLAEVNELDEDQAFAAHETIDHAAGDLGHFHAPKPEGKTDSEATDSE